MARQGSPLGMLVTLARVGSVGDGSILTPENEELILFLIGLDRESNTFNFIPYLKRFYPHPTFLGTDPARSTSWVPSKTLFDSSDLLLGPAKQKGPTCPPKALQNFGKLDWIRECPFPKRGA